MVRKPKQSTAKGRPSSPNIRRTSSPKNAQEQINAVSDDIWAEIIADISDGLLPMFLLMVEAVKEAHGWKDENGLLPSEKFGLVLKRLENRDGQKVQEDLNKAKSQNRPTSRGK